MPIVHTRFTDVEYLDEGPRTGAPVVMVHGFPDHPGTWDDVVPLLPGGLRIIRPFLRGVGRSRVVRSEARSAQVAALATDLLELVRALELGPVVLVGHDWGARAAHAVAALAPEMVSGLVTMATAYGPSSLLSGQEALDEVAVAWYRYWLCTQSGAAAFRQDPGALVERAWKHWSPALSLSADERDDVLRAVDTEDFADHVVHYYRHGSGEAPGAPVYAETQEFLDSWPRISTPTTFLHGTDDGCETPTLARANAEYFTAGRLLLEVDGVGHFLQREDPRAVADAIAQHIGADDTIAQRR
jgi:pimeloyl-ACP methyl ester carboxylesterase